jgi:hypothetical protein
MNGKALRDPGHLPMGYAIFIIILLTVKRSPGMEKMQGFVEDEA